MKCLFTLMLLLGCSPQHNKGMVVTVETTDSEGLISSNNGDDEAMLANQEIADRYEYWIAMMDPYVTQNSDWTYSFDREGFLNSIRVSSPDVYAYFMEMNVVPSNDALAANDLLDGLTIVNMKMAHEYDRIGGSGTPPSVWSVGYWWGRKVCYTSSDLTMIKRAVCGGALVLYGVPIGAAYLGYLCYVATSECSSQFCINFTWVGVAWGSCS